MRNLASRSLAFGLVVLALPGILLPAPRAQGAPPRVEGASDALADIARSVRELTDLVKQQAERDREESRLRRVEIATAVLQVRARRVESLEEALREMERTADTQSRESSRLESALESLRNQRRDAAGVDEQAQIDAGLSRIETQRKSLAERSASTAQQKMALESQLAESRRAARGLEDLVEEWLATLE